MTAAEFIGQLFLARDVAHSVHLNTRSFSKHMALNTFYDSIIDHADAFAEAYQGRHGLIGPITLHSAKKTNNIVEFLEDGDKVKITLRFRGREMAHKEIGFELINKVIEDIKEYGEAESTPKLLGRNIIVTFNPVTKKA